MFQSTLCQYAFDCNKLPFYLIVKTWYYQGIFFTLPYYQWFDPSLTCSRRVISHHHTNSKTTIPINSLVKSYFGSDYKNLKFLLQDPINKSAFVARRVISASRNGAAFRQTPIYDCFPRAPQTGNETLEIYD